ncbi:hypothetical protein P3342_007915 [Pyrenophora teres f. teres]|uniref:Protein kinase domain-containing protein n=2 Tax=Pyrenophora teres f. teres TaxID=97479 RepID=E3S061_PYRTT|nr:hypothetical protein PTT_15410 [Pyrenophora teres f. teres 0-1]KAE8827597.1 hypothetical protein HRS9122_09578 [Pyrenophora teres f. teres]KAE8839200.1 hypothetical protein HRS9139_03583 [Pyrenophora teres f. teres]KAE8845165.1 hypothetical protein PTNB85_03430 [Pyrenophora teres f. teres]KAE8865688.1 hypothetical protein PTNB29_02835 [Pyrenophora teres f. teres]
MSSDLQVAVRAYLSLSLSLVQEPTTAATLLKHQLSPSPIHGITLEKFLRHPPTSIHATVIFAIFFKLMNAPAPLHKRHVLHGNICPENIILGIPAATSLLD